MDKHRKAVRLHHLRRFLVREVVGKTQLNPDLVMSRPDLPIEVREALATELILKYQLDPRLKLMPFVAVKPPKPTPSPEVPEPLYETIF